MSAGPASEGQGGAGQPRGLGFLIDQFEEIIAGVAVAVVIGSVSWGVITRYVTAHPATWSSEVATLAFAWVVFFGSAACIKYHLHPAIEVLIERFSPRWRALVNGFNHVLVLSFFVFMSWFGARFAIDAWESPSGVLRVPLTWLYGPVAFCFMLMIVRYLQVLAGHTWYLDQNRETNAS